MKTVALFLVAALLSSCFPVWAEDVICFPLSDGTRILQALESEKDCRAAAEAGAEAINSCEARSTALEGRVREQEGEISDAKKTIEDTRKAGEEASKIAAGPWYQKILAAGKWIAIGIVIGFVGGMAK